MTMSLDRESNPTRKGEGERRLYVLHGAYINLRHHAKCERQVKV